MELKRYACLSDTANDIKVFKQTLIYAYENKRPFITRRPGGTCQNFDRDACPIFLGLKFGQILFFWVGKFFSYFLGFAKFPLFFFGSDKFPAIFLGLPIFVSHN